MNIVTIKKSILAALAVTVISTGSMTAFTGQAEAGYRSYGGHSHHYGHGYKHRRYGHGYGYKRHCWTERRWRTDYNGYSYKTKVRVCR